MDAMSKVIPKFDVALDSHYYVRSLTTLLSDTQKYFLSLLKKSEIENFDKLLSTDENSLIVFCRLCQRQNEYAKNNSLFKGVKDCTTVSEMNRLTDQLIESRLFETLTPTSSFSDAWSAITSCFKSDDLSGLLSRLHLPRVGDVQTKLDVLYSAIMTVRTLKGSLKNEIAEHVVKYLQTSEKNPIFLVRVRPELLHFLRRVLRLVQVPSASSGESLSIYRPPVVDLPLLVVINKLKFPAYTITSSVPIFLSQRNFLQWEAANELKVLLWEAKSIATDLITAIEGSSGASFLRAARVQLFCRKLLQEAKCFETGDINDLGVLITKLLDLAAEAAIGFVTTTSLVVALCLEAYMAAARQHEDCDASRPDFYRKIDAGQVLSSACWEAVALCEHESHRNYQLAVQLLLLLLRCSFSAHRRGRCYLRLLIDIRNLRNAESEAAEVLAGSEDTLMYLICKTAIADGAIKDAELTDITLRKNSIVAKFAKSTKQTDAEASTYLDGVCSSLDLSFVEGLIGSLHTASKILAASSLPSQALWNCGSCTFDNIPKNTRCEICSAVKPSKNVAPTSSVSSSSTSFSSIKVKGSIETLVDLNKSSSENIDFFADEIFNSTKHEIDNDEDETFGGSSSSSSSSLFHLNLIGDPRTFSPTIATLTGNRLGLIVKHKKQRKSAFIEDERDAELDTGLDAPSTDRKRKSSSSQGTVGRAGKSRFVSPDGDIVGVEELVKLRLAEERPHYLKATIPKLWGVEDLDEKADQEFHAAARGGGWRGWHCEGAPVRSLFALCMWHLLFPGSDDHQFPTEVVPDVFMSPYQDAPLDLDFPSFYSNRKNNIDNFLAYLSSASSQDLISLIGDRYRSHYRTSCRGMDWRIKLRHLQAIAVCLGGGALATIFRTLAIDYKHFSGGMPDLLMVRCIRVDQDKRSIFTSYDRWLGDNWEELNIFDTKREWSQQADLNSLASSIVTLKDGDPNTDDAVVELKGSDEMDDTPTAVFPSRQSIFTCIDHDIELPSSFDSHSNMNANDIKLPSYEFECALVEVKGPTDKLSHRQLVWLQVLQESRIDSWVCRISEISSHS